jgi:hypothetical protein
VFIILLVAVAVVEQMTLAQQVLSVRADSAAAVRVEQLQEPADNAVQLTLAAAAAVVLTLLRRLAVWVVRAL